MTDVGRTVVPSQSRLENFELRKGLGPKPPLLPKPQFATRNGKLSPVKKIQTSSSQTIISVSNSDPILRRDEVIANNNNNIEKRSEKPPTLYPKPKLPPKSNAFKSSRTSRSEGDSPTSPPNGEATPVRPPRSPKRTPKTSPLDDFQSRVLLFESPQSRQKSASLPRSEFANWSFREFVDEGLTTPTPRPRQKNKPKLKLELDLARNEPIYATIDYNKKKKNRQASLGSSPISGEQPPCDSHRPLSLDSVFYCGCRRFDGAEPAFRGVRERDANGGDGDMCSDGSTATALGGGCGEDGRTCTKEKYANISANNNNCDSFNSNYNALACTEEEDGKSAMIADEESSCVGDGGGSEERRVVSSSTSSSTALQSFLHRFASCSPKSAPPPEEERPRVVAGSCDNSSFLHGDRRSRSVAGTEDAGSFEVVSLEDVNGEAAVRQDGGASPTKSEAVAEVDCSADGKDVRGSSTETRQQEDVGGEERGELSEGSSRASSCHEETVATTGKRFPWFGSFGKGNKKRTEKKERCSSQFYATPIILHGDGSMNDCSRTKSLPNIKSNDKTCEADDSDWGCRNAGESLNSGFSSLDGEDDKDSVNEAAATTTTTTSKAFLIAKELMTSEEVFIDVLKLLNVDFRNYVESRRVGGSGIPASHLSRILNHLPELQALNEVLLADLRKRIQDWETNPKISDVIVKKGAFLKLYTSYIQNFESQTKFLDECVSKYPKFGKILKEFESLDRCKMLTLKHYMLKPVQRIPQYRLLLSDYLKNIDESSPDYEDTENALKIVSEVADHVNRNLKYGDKNGTLMHFQSLLSDYELIRPGRELIKDGPLEKICRKSVKDRYFILLNDCLLHTTYSKNSLKIHQELPLSGMKVCCNEEQKHRFAFAVYSVTRSFILCAKSDAERNEWVRSLRSAIEQFISRQKTFMNVKIPETDAFKLGKEAPVWIQDSKVTMCQICTAEFTSLFRRHHCRACGKVVCKNCGSNQAPLQYDSFKPHRVCDQCFPALLKDYDESEDDIYEILKMNNSYPNQDIQNIYLNNKTKFIKYTSSSSKPKFIPLRLKEVSANDTGSEMNGLLYRKSRKTWKQHWYVLKEHVLYVYRASEDIRALETIPVLGYEVRVSDVNYENVDKNLIIILEHRHQGPMIFHADTEEFAERWFKALKKASEFEDLPAAPEEPA